MNPRSRCIANSDFKLKARFASWPSAKESLWTLTRWRESNEFGDDMKRITLPGLFVAGVFVATLIFAVAFRSAARQEAGPAFDLTNAMIPMPAGVKLNTTTVIPKNAAGPLPIILERTPYNAPESPSGWAQGKYAALVADGYIFVFQDIRGRYKSEGQFVMQRSPVSLLGERSDPKV